MTPSPRVHWIWCETVGCGCLTGAHHHHHDYVDTLHVDSKRTCEACAEAERRMDDEWNRPYRWVYDWSPPCICDTPAEGVGV